MEKYKKIIGSLLFAVITLAMLYGTANLLRDRETTLADLYSEEKGSIDMVIVGSSHVNNGIIPNIFWEENGISATNAYSWAQPTWTAYYYIREALRVQDPDIVILDLYGMTYGNSYIMPEEIDRINYENSFNIDMNLNFLGLIRTSEKVGLDLRNYEDFLNLPRYHTRWKDLDLKMLTYDPHNDRDFLKGYGLSYQAAAQQQPDYQSDERMVPYEFCVEYLDKIVALCEKKDVDLIFTMIPYLYNETEVKIDNWLEDYARQHEIPYLSYIGEEAQELDLDYQTDFRDNGHLNLYGAQKVTMNLSAFLKERYPDYRKEDNPCAALLDEDYLKYQRVLQANKIMAESDLGQYLDQVLADSGYTLYLINDGSALTDQLAQALERAGIGQEDCTRLCARLNASSSTFGQTSMEAELFDRAGSVQFTFGDNVQILLNDYPAISIDSNFKAVLYDAVLGRPLETIAYDESSGTLSHKEFSTDIIGLFQ